MTITSEQAAKYLCKESGWKLSNIELHKMIYIAHMLYMGRKGINYPLVTGSFYAQEYGPVHQELYNHIEKFLCGSNPIPEFSFIRVRDAKNGDETFALKKILELYPPGSTLDLISDIREKGRAWDRKYVPGIKGMFISEQDIIQEYNDFEKIKKDETKNDKLFPSRSRHNYRVSLDPIMDNDLEKLEKQINMDRDEFFLRAMKLYYIIKSRQLSDKKLSVLLKDSKGDLHEFSDF